MSKKILVIDDSALMRRVISDIINENNEYEVAAIAKDGVEGFEMIVSHPNTYSAIILDINMPKMNGLELLKELQKNHIEQTVIVVSTVAKEGAKETILALEYGAFDFVTKPENYLDTKGDDFKSRIHNMLEIATNSRASIERTRNISDISRNARTERTISSSTHTTHTTYAHSAIDSSSQDKKEPLNTRSTYSGVDALKALRERNVRAESTETKKISATGYTGVKSGKKKLVALACSTGGPKSLQQVIPYLPKKLDAGVVLVQHMPKGFTNSLAVRLDELSEVHVKEAEDGDVVSKGCVYIAPGGRHMRVNQRGSDYVIALSDEAPIDALRPCANVMYDSLVDCTYDELTCVVLTGMGADGTKGIKNLADNNKKIHVIGQDEETCVVYGMPKAIAQAGLVNEVVPLNQVAEAITKNVGVS